MVGKELERVLFGIKVERGVGGCICEREEEKEGRRESVRGRRPMA